LTFGDSGVMRDHFRSDFHRFNLKRKVAKLPPVSLHLFQQKILELQFEQPVSKGKQHLKKDKLQKQKQQNRQADQVKTPPHSVQQEKIQEWAVSTTPDHNKSHGEENNKTEDEMIEEKIATSVVLTLKDSLFDRHQSSDFESNMQYMTREFGFFIPELEYLKDLPGLITYLGQKISVGNSCIYCEKTFYSMEATRDHMRAVSHCKILWDDNEQEYSDYYDLDAADKRFSHTGPDGDGNTYISKNNELVLSDKNKVLGHRTLLVYYKQRAHSEGQQQLITSLMQEHKRLAALEKQCQLNLDKKAYQKRIHNDLKVGMRNNYQLHYREQNPK